MKAFDKDKAIAIVRALAKTSSFEYAGIGENAIADGFTGQEFNIDLESVDRDVFYGMTMPHMYAEALKNAGVKSSEQPPLQKLFEDCFSDSDGDEQYTLFFGNKDGGDLIKIEGTLGPYCDENFDANGNLTIFFACPPHEIRDKIMREAKLCGERLASDLQDRVNGMLNGLPSEWKDEVNSALTNEFLQKEFFRPVLAQKSKTELLSHVEEPMKAKRPSARQKM